MNFPERYRADNPLRPLIPGDKGGGFFRIPYGELLFNCVANKTNSWEHVCVAIYRTARCPTWEEMCWVKDQFWDEETPVMQLHPARSEWVSNHPFALHLWHPTTVAIPLPPSIMVGVKRPVF